MLKFSQAWLASLSSFMKGCHVTNELCIVKLMLSPNVSIHRQFLPCVATQCQCTRALANAIYDHSGSGTEGTHTRLGK